MPTVLILGGTSTIARAVAAELAARGFDQDTATSFLDVTGGYHDPFRDEGGQDEDQLDEVRHHHRHELG